MDEDCELDCAGFVGVAIRLPSLVSAVRAHGDSSDRIGGLSLSELSTGRPDMDTAMRARRATAAVHAVGFATLFLLSGRYPGLSLPLSCLI